MERRRFTVWIDPMVADTMFFERMWDLHREAETRRQIRAATEERTPSWLVQRIRSLFRTRRVARPVVPGRRAGEAVGTRYSLDGGRASWDTKRTQPGVL
jgi:hypothetical protein